MRDVSTRNWESKASVDELNAFPRFLVANSQFSVIVVALAANPAADGPV
jgi:hypothetical protein